MNSSLKALQWSTLLVLTFLTVLVTGSSAAEADEPTLRAELARSGLVSLDLVEALGRSDRVGARIYFLDPGSESVLGQSHSDSEVSPVVLDLANTLLPGKLGLHQIEHFQALTGVVNAEAVQALLGNPSVLGIELDETVLVPEEAELPPGLKAACVPTSTKACLQGGRFSVTVFMSGALAKVASTSADSAAFWRFSSANWEVLAKVLNGCAINNKFWVFAGRASTQGYTLTVIDTNTGASIAFNGAICPIANTAFFNCP